MIALHGAIDTAARQNTIALQAFATAGSHDAPPHAIGGRMIARLTGILAEHRANIVETSYDRAYRNVNLGTTAIVITMEMRGPDHIAELIAALAANGYAQERIL